MNATDLDQVDFEKGGGLIAAIAQDHLTLQVLMMAWMSREALRQTLESGEATFFSRSRGEIWHKGETSGNRLKVIDVALDCDKDAVLLSVAPMGPACHLGMTSCFGSPKRADIGQLALLEGTIAARAARNGAERSYTAKLLASDVTRIAQKVGEEGVEVALAAVVGTREQLCEEGADLLYHLMVTLKARDLSLTDVMEVLKRRAGAAL
jgi:phosphoribosyl-ATP pyrophosphohydrolase/phosphoribosyl-AMP cyclohydrolase